MSNFDEKKLKDCATEDGVQKIVASAVIARDDTFFLARRCQGDFLPGLVELPGGTLEEGEKIFDGLHREILEETGLKITKVVSYIGSFDYLSTSNFKARQFNFLVEVEEGEVIIDPEEHDEYYFLTKEEILEGNYRISDNTREVLEMIF